MRILQFKTSKSHRADLYLEYNTLPINLLFKLKISTFIHKCLYNKELLPLIFQNYICLNNSIHLHGTRSKDLVHISQVNKRQGSRALNILGARIWNDLPQTITSISNIISFGNRSKCYYLSELIWSSAQNTPTPLCKQYIRQLFIQISLIKRYGWRYSLIWVNATCYKFSFSSLAGCVLDYEISVVFML